MEEKRKRRKYPRLAGLGTEHKRKEKPSKDLDPGGERAGHISVAKTRDFKELKHQVRSICTAVLTTETQPYQKNW